MNANKGTPSPSLATLADSGVAVGKARSANMVHGRMEADAGRRNAAFVAYSQAPIEMGAGIAASPHCAERRICRCSLALVPLPKEYDPASRSWLTSSGVASDRTALSEEKPDFYWTALPEGSLVFRCPASSKTEVFAQNRPIFRGPSWVDLSRVPLRSPSSEEPGNRVALEKEDSSGASSRLAPD